MFFAREVENLAKKAIETAAVLGADSQWLSLTAKEIRGAAENTAKAEEQALGALAEARKLITARQIEAKGKEMGAETSAELIKFQARLSAVQSEVHKARSQNGSIEERLACKHMADETTKKVKAVEEKVRELQEHETKTTKTETTAKQAQVELRAAQRFMQYHSRSNGMQKELLKFEPKVRELQESIKEFLAKAMDAEEKSAEVVEANSFENKATKLSAVLAATKQLEQDSNTAVAAALRKHQEQTGLKPDALFKKLAGESERIPIDALRALVEELKPVEQELGFDSFSDGMSKVALFELLQPFYRCVKSIAMTAGLNLKDNKCVYKIVDDEIVEIFGDFEVEESTGLVRAKCRTKKDMVGGYATVKNNHGTTFLERCLKPYFCCVGEKGSTTPLQADIASDSGEIRKIEPQEILEVLEGPRRENNQALGPMRVKCHSMSDDAEGWFTLDSKLFQPWSSQVQVADCT